MNIYKNFVWLFSLLLIHALPISLTATEVFSKKDLKVFVKGVSDGVDFLIKNDEVDPIVDKPSKIDDFELRVQQASEQQIVYVVSQAIHLLCIGMHEFETDLEQQAANSLTEQERKNFIDFVVVLYSHSSLKNDKKLFKWLLKTCTSYLQKVSDERLCQDFWMFFACIERSCERIGIGEFGD